MLNCYGDYVLTVTSEPFCVDRLSFVVGYLYARDRRVENKIDKLIDHEGALTIYWKLCPTVQNKKDAEDAWESSFCNECAINVEHIYHV